MRKTIGTILSIIVGLMAYHLVKNLVAEYRTSDGIDKAAVKVSADIEKQMADSAKKNPDAPSVALAEQAVKSSADSINGADSPKQKLMKASEQFYGYYYVNTKSRYEYCAVQGVSIAPYVNAFKAQNAKLMTIATRGLDGDVALMNNLMGKIDTTFTKAVTQGMTDMAKANNVTAKELCNYFATNPVEAAKLYQLQDVAPVTYKTLISN